MTMMMTWSFALLLAVAIITITLINPSHSFITPHQPLLRSSCEPFQHVRLSSMSSLETPPFTSLATSSSSLSTATPSSLPSSATSGAAMNETAVFGGGCFWCIEACFQQLEGVLQVENGYAGGKQKNPTYNSVCGGYSGGHAEVVQVVYDPRLISYRQLVDVHFAAHDPTQGNRQGLDIGSQYRSIILYTSEEQRRIAEEALHELDAKLSDGVVGGLIKGITKKQRLLTTELKALDVFYKGETYHQNYFENNKFQPYCLVNVVPKIAKLYPKVSALNKQAREAAAGETQASSNGGSGGLEAEFIE